MTRLAGLLIVSCGIFVASTGAGEAQYGYGQVPTHHSPNLDRFDTMLMIERDLDILRHATRSPRTTRSRRATRRARTHGAKDRAVGIRRTKRPGHGQRFRRKPPRKVVRQRPWHRKPGDTLGRIPRPTHPRRPGAGKRPGASIAVRRPGPVFRPPVPPSRPTDLAGPAVAAVHQAVPRPRAAPRSPSAAPVVVSDRYRPREVLVALPGEVSADFLADLSRTYDIEPRDSLGIGLLGARIYRFAVRGARTVPQVVAAIQADSRVGDVQPNYIAELQGETAPSGAGLQYALASLSVTDALSHATGRDVTIAVIDTGVDMSHPELRGVVAGSFDAVRDGTPAAAPHGTAVAGIIGARGTLRGVAPGARLLAVRAFSAGDDGSTGETDSLTLARGMDWAASRGAAIFNMSFAGPQDPLLGKLLDAASDRGIVLVAAAGNGGPDAEAVWPAAHRDVIAVTAIDHADRLYTRANRGDYIAVAAPGVDILAPATDGSYGVVTGTSMAAAHVSGIIALTLEAGAAKGSQAARELLAATAHDLGPAGRDDAFGAGKANALDALLAIGSLSATRLAGDPAR